MKKRFCPSLLRSAFTIPLCAALAFWPLWTAPAAAGNYDVTVTVAGDVYGNGDPDYETPPAAGTAANNGLTVKNGGEVNGDVFGGYAEELNGDALARENAAAVESGGAAKQDAYGGSAYSHYGSATAADNTATVTAGGEAGDIRGGNAYSEQASATAQGNRATIGDGAAITGNITGGHATANGSGSATAQGNSVTINGGTLETAAFISGGTAFSQTGTALASGNTVTISGGAGIPNLIYGGSASGGHAAGNSVIISGGTFGDTYIYGGFSAHGGNVTGNSVIISGGTFGEAFIYGGRNNDTGNATGNSVTLFGAPYLAQSGIFGGDSLVSGSGDIFSGNTLNVKTAGLTVASIGDFEHLNFYLPSTLAAGGTMLFVTDSACLTENANGSGRSSQIHVGIDGAGSLLQTGDRVTLIDASAATGVRMIANSGLNATTSGEGMAGVTMRYEFDVVADAAAGLLTAIVTNTGVNEQAKALVEGVMGGLSLAAQGGDTVAGGGMANAVSAAKGAAKGAAGGAAGGAATGAAAVAGFSAASGGSMRLNSGSHVDMNSFSIVAGLAWGEDFSPGRMTFGGFFEYGNGSYDTYNSFGSAASAYGNGDTYYWGGGILSRMDFTDSGPGHFYAEGSLRMGKISNEYKNDDLRDSLGRRASYDSDSLYYGLHFGSGYVWNITGAASLDLYGKYFWTRQEGDHVAISTGESVHFKDVDSHRLRAGSRFAYAVNEYVAPYIGAAWEHEFDGKARATSNGQDLPAPSLRGDTGIGELGLTFTPSQNLPLSFDLGVQGYVGKREGVTGSLQIILEF